MVESIDSTIRQCRIDRFWSIFRIFVDFWPNLGYGGFGGAESNGAILFFLKIHISGRIDRFDNCEWIDSDRLFKFWSIFDQTLDIEVFMGAESNGGVFCSKSIFVVESIDYCTQIELREYCGHFSHND